MLITIPDFLSIFLDTFYAMFSPLDIYHNFFQFGLMVLIILLVIGFFMNLFIKKPSYLD